MTKELFVSSSPHETKVAVFEDDQLVEVYYERDTDVGLVGGIYKGRVSRVLPGMQSAFVDIGLERDAFLYVSDFYLEDQEEYEKVFDEAEARAGRYNPDQSSALESRPAQPEDQVTLVEPAPGAGAASPPSASPPAGAASESPPIAQASGPGAPEARTPPSTVSQPSSRQTGEPLDYRRSGHRGRRHRRSGRGFGERRYSGRSEFHVPKPEGRDYGPPRTFEILPGESLAKYSHVSPTPSSGGATAGPSLTEGETEPSTRIGTETAHSSPAVVPTGPLPTPSTAEHATQFHGSEVVPSPSALGVGEIPAPSPWQTDSPSPSLRAETKGTPGSDTSAFQPPSGILSSADEAGQADFGVPTRAEDGRTGEAPGTEVFAKESSGTPSTGSDGAPAPRTEVEPRREPDGDSRGLSEASSTTGPAPTSEPQAEGQSVSSTPHSGLSERTYTLREPYQRPHYAPRRGRRGRRGMGHRSSRPAGLAERSRSASVQAPQISELLKEGQEILVQIAKEPLGTKGARITSHVALPGRYLVYLPTIAHIGVSRKVGSEQERLRLRNIVLENKGSQSGGFIVRTAGQGRTEEELKADIKFLSTLWSDIKTKAEQNKAPSLIHRDLDLVQRILRDILSPEFKAVRVDSETEYERILEFVNRVQPALSGHVKLYTRDAPLFEEFGIEVEIEKALKPKVWLKSGGYIVINQTEALVAIDVNTGKYVGKTSRLEDTILKTNIDAVNEIVRQIRLRDLGGIIVIDFIDMDERRNRLKVVQALEDALRRDRAPTKTISLHDFGLVAITRKRVKQSLERTLSEPCNYCSGSGWIKSVNTVCYEILKEAKKMARQIEGEVITLRVNPEVARAMKSREGMLISELESITQKDVIIKSDPSVHQERFEIF